MVLLAAFDVLLARHTHQEDILVGSPVADRPTIETEALIGCFINTVVLRCDLSGHPTFRTLLARVRDAVLDADAYKSVPFERVVEAVQPVRSLNRSPLFQVMFTAPSAPSISSCAAAPRPSCGTWIWGVHASNYCCRSSLAKSSFAAPSSTAPICSTPPQYRHWQNVSRYCLLA